MCTIWALSIIITACIFYINYLPTTIHNSYLNLCLVQFWVFEYLLLQSQLFFLSPSFFSLFILAFVNCGKKKRNSSPLSYGITTTINKNQWFDRGLFNSLHYLWNKQCVLFNHFQWFTITIHNHHQHSPLSLLSCKPQCQVVSYFGFENTLSTNKREIAVSWRPQSCFSMKWMNSSDTENKIFFSYGFSSKWQLTGQQNTQGIYNLKALCNLKSMQFQWICHVHKISYCHDFIVNLSVDSCLQELRQC